MKTIYHGEETEITRRDILSLDIATHCGFHSVHESGTWNFKESKSRNNNKGHKHFRDTLVAYVQKYNIKQIIAEDVRAGAARGGFNATVVLSEFRGILKEVCDELDLPEPIFINPTSLKAWATGDGHADKKKMIEFCIKRWGITPVDDNEADAIHIYYYFCRKFNL